MVTAGSKNNRKGGLSPQSLRLHKNILFQTLKDAAVRPQSAGKGKQEAARQGIHGESCISVRKELKIEIWGKSKSPVTIEITGLILVQMT